MATFVVIDYESEVKAEEVRLALRINAEARIRALKVGFLWLSGLALLAIFPCTWLPTYKPGEIPSGQSNKAEPS